ncbi:uncharacterized protein LOC144823305 isoform X4 [Lissotriton helveticus]
MNNWRSRPPAHPEQGHKPQNGRKSGPWAPSKQGNKLQGERRARAKTRHPRPISDVLVQRQIKIAEKTSIEQNGRTSGPWAPSKQGNNPQGERRARAKTRHPRPISDVLVQRQIKIAEKTSIQQNGRKSGPWAPSKQGNKPQGERRARAKTRHPRPISDVLVQKKNKIAEKTSIEQSPAFSAAVQKMDQTIEKKPHDKPPPPDTATQRPDQETEETSIKQSLAPSAVDGEKGTKDALPTTNVADQKLDPTIEKKSLEELPTTNVADQKLDQTIEKKSFEETPPPDTANQRPDQETEETSIKQSLPPSEVGGENGTKDASPTTNVADQKLDQTIEKKSLEEPPPPDTAIQRPDQETEETSIKQSPPPSAVDGEKGTKDAPPPPDTAIQRPDQETEETSIKQSPPPSAVDGEKGTKDAPPPPDTAIQRPDQETEETSIKQSPPPSAVDGEKGTKDAPQPPDTAIQRPDQETEETSIKQSPPPSAVDGEKGTKDAPPPPDTAIQRPDQETEETSIKQSPPPSAVDGEKDTKDATPSSSTQKRVDVRPKITPSSSTQKWEDVRPKIPLQVVRNRIRKLKSTDTKELPQARHSSSEVHMPHHLGYIPILKTMSLIKEADSACPSGAMSSRHGSIVKQFRSDVSIKRSNKADWKEGYPTSLTHVKPLKEQENQNNTWKEMNKSRDSSKDKKQSGDVDKQSSSSTSLFPKLIKPPSPDTAIQRPDQETEETSIKQSLPPSAVDGEKGTKDALPTTNVADQKLDRTIEKKSLEEPPPPDTAIQRPDQETEETSIKQSPPPSAVDGKKGTKDALPTANVADQKLDQKIEKKSLEESLNKEADSACASGATSSRHGSIWKQFRSIFSIKRSNKADWKEGYPTSLTHVKPLKEQENQNNTWKEMNKSRDSSKDKKQSGDVDTRSSSPSSLFPKHFKSLNKEADSACASGAMSSRHGSILKEFRSCVSLKRSDKDEWRKGYPTSLTHVKPLKEQENQNNTWKEMNKSRDSSKDKKQSGDVDTRSSSPSSLFPKHFKDTPALDMAKETVEEKKTGSCLSISAFFRGCGRRRRNSNVEHLLEEGQELD